MYNQKSRLAQIRHQKQCRLRQKQILETEIEIGAIQTRITGLSQSCHYRLSHQESRGTHEKERDARQLWVALLNNVLGIAPGAGQFQGAFLISPAEDGATISQVPTKIYLIYIMIFSLC